MSTKETDRRNGKLGRRFDDNFCYQSETRAIIFGFVIGVGAGMLLILSLIYLGGLL